MKLAIVAHLMEGAESSAPAETAAWRRGIIAFLVLTGGIKTTMAFTSVSPGLLLIAEHFRGMGDNILGAQLVMTFATAGMVLAGLFSGWVAVKVGLRRTLFISLALSTVCGLLQLVIDSFPLLLASRFVLGGAVVTVDVALTTILAAQFVGAQRSRIVGFRQAISSSGTVVTLLLSGYIVEHFGWRAPAWMFLFPAVSLVMAIIVFDKPIAFTRRTRAEERFSMLQLWPIYLLCLVISGTHTLPSLTMPFLLKEDGITSAELISRVPALSAFISVIAAAGFGYAYVRAGRWTLVVAALFMGAGFVAVGVAPTYNLILACVIVEGFGAGWTMPYFSSRLLDRVTPAQRSQAMGILLSAMFLGGIAQPLITAPIRHAYGVHATFICVGLALIASAVALGVWALIGRGKDTMI
jgi:MFS family permease